MRLCVYRAFLGSRFVKDLCTDYLADWSQPLWLSETEETNCAGGFLPVCNTSQRILCFLVEEKGVRIRFKTQASCIFLMHQTR